MSEKLIETIITKNDFKAAFDNLDVKSTDACMVHTAMSKFQYLPGGPKTIVRALEETLSVGTLMCHHRFQRIVIQQLGSIHPFVKI